MFSRLATSNRSVLQPFLKNKQFLQFAANFHAGAPTRDNDAAVAATEEAEPTLWDTIKEPMIMGPMIGLLSTGAVGNHIYHFDEETQLLGLFALFVGTIFTTAGESIGKGIDDQTRQILADMNEQEDALIERMQLACEKMESFVAASEDLKQVLAYKKSLIGDVLDAKTNATKLRVHNHFDTLLRNAVMAEERERNALKSALVEAATAQVTQDVGTKAMRAKSLEEALKVVKGEEAADVVGQQYVKFFESEAARMEKEAASSVVEKPADKAALFAQLTALTADDVILSSDDQMSRLVQSLVAEAQTVGEQANLLVGPESEE